MELLIVMSLLTALIFIMILKHLHSSINLKNEKQNILSFNLGDIDFNLPCDSRRIHCANNRIRNGLP